MFRFSDEDLKKYDDITPNWGEVGAVTYKRTYARPIYDESGNIVDRESWKDTCKRVIEGNMNILPSDPTATREWALKAFDMMYHMAWLPSGRGLWMSGTEYTETRGGDGLVNCFRAGTLVHTKEGVFPIEQLEGKSVEVLSKDGVYRMADFKCYGEQPLMKVILGTGNEIYATADHQWVVQNKNTGKIEEGRVLTKDLANMDNKYVLPIVNTLTTDGIVPSKRGIAHGFTFGDAQTVKYQTKEGEKSYCRLKFFGTKMELFDLVSEFGTPKPNNKIPEVIHLPSEWKKVPERVSREYALGFVIGLISADGYVRDTINIHQANKENLEKVRALALYSGLRCTPIRLDKEINPFTGGEGKVYTFSISTYSLSKELLIKSDQIAKWRCGKKGVKKTVSVRNVETTNLVEKVYCCEEMETHTMVIDDYILTGQCWWVSVRPQSYEGQFSNTIYSDEMKPMPSFPFVFLFDRAMLGGGVGVGVTQENVSLFPEIQNTVDFKCYIDFNHPDWINRIIDSPEYKGELNNVITYDKELINSKEYVVIRLEDSREGWDRAVQELIDAHWYNSQENTIKIIFDMSDIRGYGTPIKGFGGTASGSLPLIIALHHINKILNSKLKDKISSTDALDICNILGKCVVSGNVRRTAILALGNPDDTEYTEAKNFKLVLPVLELDEYGYPIWEFLPDGSARQKRKDYDKCVEELGKEETDRLLDLAWRQENHRWASNNSVQTTEMFDGHHFIASGIIANGEPGVVNLWLSQNFGRICDGYQEGIDSLVEGTNPCGEISLVNGEPCNLAEVIPYNCEILGYNIEDALEIATNYTYRVTFAKYMWNVSQRVISENRRIGVSLTGMQDYFLHKYGGYPVIGFEDEEKTIPIFDQRCVDDLDRWYQVVKETNKKHSHLVGDVPSIKLTTCKPSGTVAKLPGVSSGIHFHYSPYLIQRIRFHETDPNLKVLEKCGYPIEKSFKEPNTMVVEFPVKAPNADNPNFKCSGDVSLEEQFANQYLFANMWADNAVSATLTFQPEETSKIEPLLKAYGNKIKSTSLLPYAGHGYVQAPWEPINKEEYDRRVSELKMSITEAYETVDLMDEIVEIEESSCASG